MCGHCGWHHREHHGERNEQGCCDHRHEGSKEMRLARMKAMLLVLQAKVKEIEKRVVELEGCECECE